jgi:hypothetical protein
MGRKISSNFIKKDVLIEKLAFHEKLNDLKELKKNGKNEIVWKAFEANLINKNEMNESLIKRYSTIPCYLYTHITDENFRNIIEEYVLNYSMLWSRGTYIANLVAISLIPLNILNPFIHNNDVPVPDFLCDENELKKCFLPERWILKDLEIPKEIKDIVEQHKELLDTFLPDYKKCMCDSGWDNAINHMGTSYLGNINVQILSHLYSKFLSYLKDNILLNIQTNREQYIHMVCSKLFPSTEIHIDDYEFIDKVRKYFNIKPSEFINKKSLFFSKLNNKNWTLHLFLLSQKNNKISSILPYSIIGRKYSYLDIKIANALLPKKLKTQMLQLSSMDTESSELQKLFGLTRTIFNKTRTKQRNKLRKKFKNNEKLKKKWKKNGRSSLPKDTKIVTISTDGIGLRICLEFIPKKNYNETSSIFLEKNVVNVGIDTGRVRLITACSSDGNVSMITRKAYYRAQRHKQSQEFEKSKMKDTPWGQAINDLSKSGGFKNKDMTTWINALNILSDNFEIIKSEQLISKTRALMKMRRFRWKKSFFDQKLKTIFKPAWKDKKLLNIGLGDGDFPCTGKGELSVPTTDLQRSIKRVIKMMNISKMVKIVPIDEYNTTKCCHRCGNIMDKLIN